MVVTAKDTNQGHGFVDNFAHSRTIVYTTKRHCLERLQAIAEFPTPVAAIANYGLPDKSDLKFITESGQKDNWFFMGDAHPPDLLTFAWLRECIRDFTDLKWYGVNDEFSQRHRDFDDRSILIPLFESEKKSIPLLLHLCPDYRELIGEYCSSLLASGFKIEIEGAI